MQEIKSISVHQLNVANLRFPLEIELSWLKVLVDFLGAFILKPS